MIHKIVLTGGPCGGKTSALPLLVAKLRNSYHVVTVPESATLLFNNGFILLSPPETTIIKQTAIIKFQIALEDAIATAEKIVNKPTIMLCDRGIMDAKAYSGIYWDEILKQNNWSESMFLNRYDAVCHLVSAAIGTDMYTKANNAARFETAEEAVNADKRTQNAWSSHQNLAIFDNSTDFDGKVDRIIKFVEQQYLKVN